MKASELRLGNWVTTTERDCECDYQAIGIGEDFVDLHHPYKCDPFKEVYGVEISSLRGIPLTEEWLEKFGFDSRPYKDGYIGKDVGNTDFVLRKPDTLYVKHNYAFEFCGFKYTELEYVHSLQNLYFALTGEELTLKE